MPRFLTIDLGTTLFKFAIFDDQGSLVALARVKPPIEHPHPGVWELNVDRFRETIRSGIAQLRNMISLDDIAAISFASQANSLVLLDSHDTPLSPLILWPDERGRPYEAAMQRASSSPGFRRETGIPVLTHQFAAAKVLAWQSDNPAITLNSPRLLFISDLLTWWFTGQHITEAGVAGLSGALDIHTLAWRQAALADLGFDKVALPAVARAGTDLGTINPAAADEFELPRGCRFVVGCLDQYAGAIGTATTQPGCLCEATGTVLAAVRCTRDIRDDPPAEVFVGPSFDPGLLFEMSFSSTSANLLEHYRNTLADHPDFDTLITLAEQATSGEPHIDSVREGQPLQSCFSHVGPEHSRGQIVRAIMETVARQLKSQVRALCEGDFPSHIVSAGGGARSNLWLQIKAQTVGIPFMATECEEPTSLGAAMLAARAIGRQTLPELAKHWVRPRSAIAARSHWRCEGRLVCMTGRERVARAMQLQMADRVPVFCQLSLGHYFLNAGIPTHRIWFTSEGFAEALVLLQRRYRFDGLLINLPGRAPHLLDQIRSIEKTPEGERIFWKNDEMTVVPEDDNPRHYSDAAGAPNRRADFDSIDPDKLDGIMNCSAYWWNTIHVPQLDGASRAGLMTDVPEYFLDTVKAVQRETHGEVSVQGEVFSPFTHFMELLGYENALMALLDDPSKAHALLERLTESSIAWGVAQAKAGVDAVLISSAFAGGGFVSREMYSEFVLPYEQRLADAVHAIQKPVYTHTCGNIGDRIDLMVETHIDGLDTMDPPPLGDTDIGTVKTKFGRKIFLKGNMNSVQLLAVKTPEQVAGEANRCLNAARDQGGYILSTACSVAPRVEPWKLEMLVPLVEENGRYR